MKKLNLFIVLILTLWGMTSCEKQDIIPTGPGSNDYIKLKLSRPQPVDKALDNINDFDKVEPAKPKPVAIPRLPDKFIEY